MRTGAYHCNIDGSEGGASTAEGCLQPIVTVFSQLKAWSPDDRLCSRTTGTKPMTGQLLAVLTIPYLAFWYHWFQSLARASECVTRTTSVWRITEIPFFRLFQISFKYVLFIFKNDVLWNKLTPLSIDKLLTL